jgi:hypothetical protein
MRLHHLAALFLLGLTATGKAAPPATTTTAPGQARPDLAWYREAMATREQRLAWWRQARFGMFVHWGVYSALGGVWEGKPVTGYAEHIQRIRKIPIPCLPGQGRGPVQSHPLRRRRLDRRRQASGHGLLHHHRQAPRRLRHVRLGGQ